MDQTQTQLIKTHPRLVSYANKLSIIYTNWISVKQKQLKVNGSKYQITSQLNKLNQNKKVNNMPAFMPTWTEHKNTENL